MIISTSSPRRHAIILAISIGLSLEPSRVAQADETPVATIEHPEPVDFQKELLPILRKNCLACHNGTDAESDLVLESPETILKGGLEGPAVVPGKPDESLMLALAAKRQEPVMPPEDNDAGASLMTPAELALLQLWIEQGAKGQVSSAETPIAWKPLPAGINPVYAAAQSPDGRLIVVGRANQAWVYDVQLGRYVDRLIDPGLASSPVANGQPLTHLDLIQSLAFSHDGQSIASGGYRTVKLWQRMPAVGSVRQLKTSGVTAAVPLGPAGFYLAHTSGPIHWVVTGQDAPVTTLNGHSGRVHALAVSPNAHWLASTGEDKTLRIWNAQQQIAVASQTQPTALLQLAWLDETTLAAAGADQKIRLWSIQDDGQLNEPRELAGHAQAITALAALGTDRLVSASQDGSVHVWSVATGESQRELDHGGMVRDLAVAASSNRLVTAGGNVPAKLWDLESGQLVAELRVNPNLQWQRDQDRLAQQVAKRHVDNLNQDLEEARKRVSEEEESLKKTQEARTKAEEELAKSKEQAQAADTERQTAEVQLSEAKQTLGTAERQLADAPDDAAKQAAKQSIEQAKQAVVDAENALKPKVEAADKAANQLTENTKALDSAQRSVATSERALADAQASIASLEPQLQQAVADHQAAQQQEQQAQEKLQAEPHVAIAVAAAGDGSLFASCDAQGNVVVWRSPDGSALQLTALAETDVLRLAFGPALELDALTSTGQVMRIEVTTRWQLAHTIGAPDSSSSLEDRITALSFSPDNHLLALGGGQPSRGGELKLYDVHQGTLVREIKDAHSDTIFGLAFSPDGTQLASCGADRFMKVFDVATGQLVRTFEGHTHHVLSVGWRADGRVLVTGGADKVVKLWKATDGSQIRTIQGFGKEVTSVQFAGAEDHFFASCGDQNLYRCDMGGQRKSISTGQDFLYVVSTNLLGKSVAFGGHDSVVRVVDDNGTQLAELKPSGP